MSRHWEFFNDLEVKPSRNPWLRDGLLAAGIGLFLAITFSARIVSGEWNDGVAAFFLFPALVLLAIVVFEQIAKRRTWPALSRLLALAAGLVAIGVGAALIVS